MKHLLLWVAGVLAIWSVAAIADDARPYGLDRPLDFGLRFSHHALDLDYGGSKIDTSVDRIAVYWRERYGERLQLGLFGGYAFLSQSNNPATAGRKPDGYHAGFSLDVDLLRSEPVDSFFSAVWLYQKVDDDNGAQQTEIATREPGARLGLGVSLGGGVRAYGGARYGRIDGEQRLSGALNETRKIGETRNTGGFVGLELKLEQDGYVGLAAESGTDRSVAIYFGKRF